MDHYSLSSFSSSMSVTCSFLLWFLGFIRVSKFSLTRFLGCMASRVLFFVGGC